MVVVMVVMVEVLFSLKCVCVYVCCDVKCMHAWSQLSLCLLEGVVEWNKSLEWAGQICRNRLVLS